MILILSDCFIWPQSLHSFPWRRRGKKLSHDMYLSEINEKTCRVCFKSYVQSSWRQLMTDMRISHFLSNIIKCFLGLSRVIRMQIISSSWSVLMRTNCPHEDRPMSPHPRPHKLFHMTVLVLVLILISVQVLILVLEDDEPVLVPSLAVKLQSLVHSSHSYAVFHHKLENWQEVDLLWAVYLKRPCFALA